MAAGVLIFLEVLLMFSKTAPTLSFSTKWHCYINHNTITSVNICNYYVINCNMNIELSIIKTVLGSCLPIADFPN